MSRKLIAGHRNIRTVSRFVDQFDTVIRECGGPVNWCQAIDQVYISPNKVI